MQQKTDSSDTFDSDAVLEWSTCRTGWLLQKNNNRNDKQKSMRLFLVVLFLIASLVTSQKPTCTPGTFDNGALTTTNVVTFGGTGADTAEQVTVDSATGNIYMFGTFSGNVSFGSFVAMSNGTTEFYVLKMSSNFVVQWVTTFGGLSLSSRSPHAIHLDAFGNIFVRGIVTGAMFVPPATTFPAYGSQDICLLKISATTGSIIWSQVFGSGGSEGGLGLTTDSAGNLYGAGFYGGIMTFGSCTQSHAGNSDILIWKMDTNGALLWCQSAGSSGSDAAARVIMDPSQNFIYVTGTFSNTVSFNGTSVTTTGTGYFLSKIAVNTGTFVWTVSGGGSSFLLISGLALDLQNNIYIGGSFSGTATMAGVSLVALGISSDLFVAKFNSSGGSMFATRFGGVNLEIGGPLYVDASNYIYFYATYSSSTTVGAFTFSVTSGSGDVFVKLDSSGNVVFATTAGTRSALITATPMAITSDYVVHIVGKYPSAMTIGSIPVTQYYGSTDIYYSRWMPTCSPCNLGSFSSVSGYTNSCSLCPANTFTVSTGSSSCTSCPGGQISSIGMLVNAFYA